MAASRRSLRLSGFEPEFTSIDSICGICKREIDVNLRNCNIKSCCSKPIHKNCLADLLHAKLYCLYCGQNVNTDDAWLENEDREDDDRVDDEARISHTLPGRLRQRALEELNELMRLENITAAIVQVSKSFSVLLSFKGGGMHFSLFRSNMPLFVGTLFHRACLVYVQV